MAKRRLCESPTDLGRCGGSADSRAELREPQPQVGQCAPWRQQRHEPATIGGRRASQTLPAYCDDGEPRSFSGTTRDSPTVTLVHPVAQRDTKHEFGEGYLRAIERAVDAEERPSKRQRTGEAQKETIFDRAGSPFSPNHFAPRKGTPLLFQSLACAPCPVLTRPFGPPPVPPATSSQKASDGSHYPSAPLDNTEAEVGVSEPIRHPPASDNQIHEPANSPGFFFCAAPERLEEHSTEVLGSSHAMQATQALLKTRAALQAIEDHPDARTIIFQRAGWGPHDMLGHILRIADKVCATLLASSAAQSFVTDSTPEPHDSRCIF